MNKIASDAVLDNSQLQKVAAFGFATALSTPSAGMLPSEVKAHTSKFAASIAKSGARHTNLVKTIRDHVTAKA